MDSLLVHLDNRQIETLQIWTKHVSRSHFVGVKPMLTPEKDMRRGGQSELENVNVHVQSS